MVPVEVRPAAGPPGAAARKRARSGEGCPVRTVGLLLVLVALVLALAAPALADSVDLGPLGTVTYEVSTGEGSASGHVLWSGPNGSHAEVRVGVSVQTGP